MGASIMEEQMKLGGWYLEYKLIKEWFIPHDIRLLWKHISMYSRQNINTLRNFLREHCLELNLLQLSHNMFCKNITCLVVARERNYVWQPSDLNKNCQKSLKSSMTMIGPTTHFWHLNWVLRSWVLNMNPIIQKNIFPSFFSKFLCARYSGFPQLLSPGVKNPKLFVFGSNFLG